MPASAVQLTSATLACMIAWKMLKFIISCLATVGHIQLIEC